MNRRSALRTTALGLGALSLTNAISATDRAAVGAGFTAGQTNHSTCFWCYNGMELEELAERGKEIGLKSIELTSVDQWPVLKKHGLTCAMGTHTNFSIDTGWNDPKNHEMLQEQYTKVIRDAADHEIPSVIVMSGNRRGMSDYDGMMNCAIGLRPMVKLAEDAGVTLQMELLNSKVNHPDYMCDRTQWGAALAGNDRLRPL